MHNMAFLSDALFSSCQAMKETHFKSRFSLFGLQHDSIFAYQSIYSCHFSQGIIYIPSF
jgi:hypothetical protein